MRISDWSSDVCSSDHEGTIVYRQCRANLWQFFQKKCIDLRGRLNMASAEQYDAPRAQVDAYCEAEQRSLIVKQASVPKRKPPAISSDERRVVKACGLTCISQWLLLH